MSVAVIKSSRTNEQRTWDATVNYLIQNGVPVNSDSVESDTFIVLGGQFENPLCLNGKRILLYKKQEWYPSIMSQGWDVMYSNLLKHYYDEMIDCSDDSPKDILEKVRCLITANS